MAVTIERVEWSDPRAAGLRAAMEAETGEIYALRLSRVEPERMPAIVASLDVDPEDIVATLLAIDDTGTAVGHAALRRLDGRFEVKKVFVGPSHRGLGVARSLMDHVEAIARDHGADALLLQTGDLQPAAIRLYESLGYHRAEAFEPYGTFPGEVFYRKGLG